MINEIFTQRLAFVKYLYELAVNQSRQPEPLSSASILTFHDGIEMFLQISSEYLNIGSNKLNFLDYWDLLNTKLPTELTQKESMRRFNKSRVALKHHGTMPSRLDIEAIRASATNFFNENCLIVFDIEFKDISMINLIDCTSAKRYLFTAETMIKKREYSRALSEIALAFHFLIKEYENKQRDLFGQSPYFFGRSLNFNNSFFMGIKDDRKMADFVDKVGESIMAMQSAMKIVSLGINYRKYAKFQLLTPIVRENMSGSFVIDKRLNQELKEEQCDYCVKFVIEAALRLQEFNYDELLNETSME